MLTCTCAGFPYPRIGGHVQCRLQELDEVHPLLCNANNVPKLNHPDRGKLLMKEVLDGVKGWANFRGVPPTIGWENVTRCLTATLDTKLKCVEMNTVRELKQQLRGLVLTPLDRNPGETLVLCPKVYYEAMMELFVCSPGYAVLTESEHVLMTGMKADAKDMGLQRFVRWDNKGHFGEAYVMPKHNDLTRATGDGGGWQRAEGGGQRAGYGPRWEAAYSGKRRTAGCSGGQWRRAGYGLRGGREAANATGDGGGEMAAAGKMKALREDGGVGDRDGGREDGSRGRLRFAEMASTTPSSPLLPPISPLLPIFLTAAMSTVAAIFPAAAMSAVTAISPTLLPHPCGSQQSSPSPDFLTPLQEMPLPVVVYQVSHITAEAAHLQAYVSALPSGRDQR
ncbi:hypothetical protein CBR_g12394 [Chara braunii]|uniref:Uncharacterized protein n=1 Tax=Chara braunii TaxID=69332 RepID=A0A388KS08_CHABU|nr:hypothetical protein CBR_g12394 [Chara braunii]|eukprot:GBG72827.1 hypothetical protein CBR_g12394 [Chara braunii]